MARLSVVVPVSTRAADLAGALERLLSADCPIEREVIVIDDGSTDGSARILRELADQGRVV